MGKKYVTYKRVSTKRQAFSGLGLEAQQETLLAFYHNWEIIGDYCDVLSGNDDKRPQLIKALELAKQQGATLVIAKLDRLSRNLMFVVKLQETGVPFQCCDMPEANEFTIQIFAAFAQYERKLISARVKEGLGAKKRRIAEGNLLNAKPDAAGNPVLMQPDKKGVFRLGNPLGYTDGMREKAKAVLQKKTACNEYTQDSKKRIMEAIEFYPNMTLKELTGKLNEYKLRTPRGKLFTANNIFYLRQIVLQEMQQEGRKD
jgi:DNA invertase Pin-like site-specific DNA recombinase